MSVKTLTRLARELVPDDVATLCQLAEALEGGEPFVVVSDGNRVFGANGPGITSFVDSLLSTMFSAVAPKGQRCS